MAQNPLANLISVPLQNNTNFGVGPQDGTQNILNIQPVIPVSLNSDWNLITRTIVPVITQPGFLPDQGSTTGLGDIQFSGFLSPSGAAGLIWGVGAIVQAPTHTNERLGNDRWGLGPTMVALHLSPGDPWVYGALVNNVWSVGSGDNPSYNNFSSPSSTTTCQGVSTSTVLRSSPPTGSSTAASAGWSRWAQASAKSSTLASFR